MRSGAVGLALVVVAGGAVGLYLLAPDAPPTPDVDTDDDADASTGVVADTARRATARIGASGGTVTATTGDGRSLALTVPEGALSDTRDITIAPLLGMEGPFGDLVVEGAVLGPDGLSFSSPVILRLELAPDTSAAGLVGFTSDGQGGNRSVFPVSVVNGTVEVPMSHFSNGGVAQVDACALVPLAPTTSVPEQTARELAAQILCGHDPTDPGAVANASLALLPVLQAWEAGGVRLHLTTMGTWPDYRLYGEAHNWSFMRQAFPDVDQALFANYTSIRDLQHAAFSRVVRDEVGKCAAAENEEEYRLHSRRIESLVIFASEHVHFDETDNGWPLEITFLMERCLEVAFLDVDSPSILPADEAKDVTVRPVVRTLTGHFEVTPAEEWTLTITVEGGEAGEPHAGDNGTYVLNVTRPGASPKMVLTIEARTKAPVGLERTGNLVLTMWGLHPTWLSPPLKPHPCLGANADDGAWTHYLEFASGPNGTINLALFYDKGYRSWYVLYEVRFTAENLIEGQRMGEMVQDYEGVWTFAPGDPDSDYRPSGSPIRIEVGAQLSVEAPFDYGCRATFEAAKTSPL